MPARGIETFGMHDCGYGYGRFRLPSAVGDEVWALLPRIRKLLRRQASGGMPARGGGVVMVLICQLIMEWGEPFSWKKLGVRSQAATSSPTQVRALPHKITRMHPHPHPVPPPH